jgi:hypothetical protein
MDDTGSTLADTCCREDEKHGFGTVVSKLDQSTKPLLEKSECVNPKQILLFYFADARMLDLSIRSTDNVSFEHL